MLPDSSKSMSERGRRQTGVRRRVACQIPFPTLAGTDIEKGEYRPAEVAQWQSVKLQGDFFPFFFNGSFFFYF